VCVCVHVYRGEFLKSERKKTDKKRKIRLGADEETAHTFHNKI
jgi:hypothetical protein